MKTYSVTDIGQKRKMNQDYVYCNEGAVGMLPNLFIVADGMGGHNAGDFASRFAVEEFVRQVSGGREKTLIKTMEEAVHRANQMLLEQAAARPELEGMGTTFVAATINGEDMYVANIGDSRLYLISGEEITQVTQDHLPHFWIMPAVSGLCPHKHNRNIIPAPVLIRQMQKSGSGCCHILR